MHELSDGMMRLFSATKAGRKRFILEILGMAHMVQIVELPPRVTPHYGLWWFLRSRRRVAMHEFVKKAVQTVFFGLALYATAGRGVGSAETTVVVPNALAAAEGGADNIYPFETFGGSLRYQQVFAASEFASLPGPSLITQIAFRPDATVNIPNEVMITSVQINLSTTAASPDGLSTTFANNVGGNDTVVFRGSLSFVSAVAGPPGGPNNFDYVVPLQTPFLYAPSAGNLLLDVRNFSGAPVLTRFDAQFVVGDSISRVYSNEDVSSPVGFKDTLGVVVQFVTAPAAISIAIDIKPDSVPNSINAESHGKIPVAVLSSAGFDATTAVDRSSLTFGRTGNEASLAFCNTDSEDVNADGFSDLICHFETEATGFQEGDVQGVLKGKTVSGTLFIGADSVRILIH